MINKGPLSIIIYNGRRTTFIWVRSLGYHRNISMENFREPNFELVADILYWFALRYDPKADISDNIEDKKDRVLFIRTVCQMFATKARITLNPKKLYEAQGYAVKEMLKIAQMMYKARSGRRMRRYSMMKMTLSPVARKAAVTTYSTK